MGHGSSPTVSLAEARSEQITSSEGFGLVRPEPYEQKPLSGSKLARALLIPFHSKSPPS